MRKIHRVSWKTTCLPREKGGIGIKNIRNINLALLNKWRWRILQGFDCLWYDLLKARYGDISMKIFSEGSCGKVPSSCSFWWKDILKIGSFPYKDPMGE